MINAEIINFIIENRGTTIAEIQNKFNITYREAKAIVDELIEKGDLVYSEGLKYNYTGKETAPLQQVADSKNELRSQLEARRRELIERMQAAQEDDDDDEDDSQPFKQDADFEEFLKDNFPDANDQTELPPLFGEGGELSDAVADRIERIIKSDVKMGLKSAIRIAEAILDAVQDINDYEIMLIYERIVSEFKNMSASDYVRLKKAIFTE